MIDVAMRVENHDQVKIVVFEFTQNLVRLEARIDDDGLRSARPPENVGVLGKRLRFDALNVK